MMNGSAELSTPYFDNECLWGGTWAVTDVSNIYCLREIVLNAQLRILKLYINLTEISCFQAMVNLYNEYNISNGYRNGTEMLDTNGDVYVIPTSDYVR